MIVGQPTHLAGRVAAAQAEPWAGQHGANGPRVFTFSSL
jgi:hypothetical protein